MSLCGAVSLWLIAGSPCTDQKVRHRMSTQRMVFNDNYWGPPRERLPELRLRASTQTKVSPLTYSHTVGRGEQTGQGFRYPVALAVNPRTGLMYVANRSYEYRIELKRMTICTVDEQFVGQFSTGGFGDGQIFWPRGLAIDQEDKVYLSDEWLQRISIWSGDGDYLGKWGTAGSGAGELNRPAGIAFDSQDNLFVVDGSNHRIQKFTKEGKFLAQWGSFGSGDGQFNFPWGIEIDSHDNVYVADWGNDRLQMFDSGGNHLYTFLGEGTLSQWGIGKLDANNYMWNERQGAWGLEREKYFEHPIAVDVDPEGRILVLEPYRTRIQVYTKNR